MFVVYKITTKNTDTNVASTYFYTWLLWGKTQEPIIFRFLFHINLSTLLISQRVHSFSRTPSRVFDYIFAGTFFLTSSR